MDIPRKIITLLCIFMLETTLTIGISIDVTTFGAVGNGISDDTEAFNKAWTEVCKDKSNPKLVVPTGKSFLVQSMEFMGPCSSSSIIFEVMGQIVAPNQNVFKDNEKWISFTQVNGLVIDGNGGFDGSATSNDWWNKGGTNRPPTLRISGCTQLSLSGLTFVRPPQNHISISDSKDVTIQNIQIKAPENSPNTDGIDISRSSNVHILHSDIQTGDDCIAINSGSSLVNITNINCGPGHGISIGSLGRFGNEESVEYVNVKSCTFTGTQNAARIKTSNNAGTGFARFISYENITVINTKNPIIIDQNYCPENNCNSEPSKIKISDLSFTGFKGTSETKDAVSFNCSPAVPCENIKVDDINIKPSSNLNEPTTSSCANAHGSSACTLCTPKIVCLED